MIPVNAKEGSSTKNGSLGHTGQREFINSTLVFEGIHGGYLELSRVFLKPLGGSPH